MATSKIHSKSYDCVKSELDIYALPSTQTSREKTIRVEIPPTGAITQDGPIEFNLAGSGDLYFEPSSLGLRLLVKLVKGDSTDLTGNSADVAPVNYLLHSMFSQIEVSLNGRTVSYMDALYPYRAMFEALTTYSKEATEGHLQNSLFYKDIAGALDETDPSISNYFRLVKGYDEPPVVYTTIDLQGDGTPAPTQPEQFGNHGLFQRWLYARNSQSFELEGKLHMDFFQQEKLLINNVDMRVKLTRAKPSFYLMSKDNAPSYRLAIQEASIFIDKVKIAEHVYLPQQKGLMQANAVYPISYVTMKSISIPTGNLFGPQDTIFLGQIPTHMIVGFVDNDSSSGNYKKNPFNFKNYDLEKIAVRVNGEQYPAKPLELKYN